MNNNDAAERARYVDRLFTRGYWTGAAVTGSLAATVTYYQLIDLYAYPKPPRWYHHAAAGGQAAVVGTFAGLLWPAMAMMVAVFTVHQIGDY